MTPTHPDPDFEARLGALRSRLKQARDERGACPPWDELKADLLPGGGNRPRRAERLAHREICPYCDSHVREWERSFDRTADALEAVEKGIVKGLADGALDLVRRLAHPGEPGPPATKPEALDAGVAPPPQAPPPAAPPSLAPPSIAPRSVAPRPVTAAPAAAPPSAPSAASAPPAPPVPRPASRILVVEMADRRTPPDAVFLCAAVLEAEVAVVEAVAELEGDPDLALVCGIVLAGARPSSEWPGALRAARAIAPGRPVALLTGASGFLNAGTRRALGEALISELDPPERLLLALDPTLR